MYTIKRKYRVLTQAFERTIGGSFSINPHSKRFGQFYYFSSYISYTNYSQCAGLQI